MSAPRSTSGTDASTCLVVLAKAPEAGQVKTRLAAAIGATAALQVYRQLLAITASAVARWPGPVLLSIRGHAAAFDGTELEHLPKVQQPEGDLGASIAAALAAGLQRAASALVIGTDCPGLDLMRLQAVATLATEAAVVFGPAPDGGFWSVGTRLPNAAALLATAGLPWSTAHTLTAVRALLATAGIDSRLGPALADCDTLADLQHAVTHGLLPARLLPGHQTDQLWFPGAPPTSNQRAN